MAYKHVWTPEEAAKAHEILRKAEAKKRTLVKIIDALLYWVLLVLAILANFVISVVLVPVLLVIKGFYLYLILAVIGVSFGWFFSFVLHSIEKLQLSQHVIAGIILPVIALINITIITVLTNRLAGLMHLETTQNPVIVGAVYVVGYILPEIVRHRKKPRFRIST